MFIDYSASVGPGYRTRTLEQIVGLALHHTASTNRPWTAAQERAHIRAIDQQHRNNDWGGIGYSALIFPSGRTYTFGPLTQQRAGIYGLNHKLLSFALVGNFQTRLPTRKQWRAATHLVLYYYQLLGRTLPVQGHRDWALAGHGTACPGNTWKRWVPTA